MSVVEYVLRKTASSVNLIAYGQSTEGVKYPLGSQPITQTEPKLVSAEIESLVEFDPSLVTDPPP